MAKTYRVYISSTFRDLEDYRKAVYQLLSKLAPVKVIAMEDYVAADQRPTDKCLSDVESWVIYVGIIAWRYGYVPPPEHNPEQKSITELEFRKAKKLGKQCLLFVLDPEAAWKRTHMDEVTKDGDAGERIKVLRGELLSDYLASKFSDPQQLAGLVNAAVASHIAADGGDKAAGAKSDAAPLFRELHNSFYLAHSPNDEQLARQLAQRLGMGIGKPVLLSSEALFAQDENGFDKLEQGVTRCHAAVALITPASLGQLAAHADKVNAVLNVARARTGPIAALLVGVKAADLPQQWAFEAAFELTASPVSAELAVDAGLGLAKQWIDKRMPRWGMRAVGVPVSVLAMTSAEFAQIEATPNFIADKLGIPLQQQFEKLRKKLTEEGAPWKERYQDEREAWRPFGSIGPALADIVKDVARALNGHNLSKLRHRQIKVQWYPFDAVLQDSQNLKSVYRAVARSGCLMLIDEVSLFHPDLREAFRNSIFVNNDQVAIVTVSPFDTEREPLNQLLEETRKKLAGAFDRYAVECDPQCELAVGDMHRLRRWLHGSLPETAARLQELKPDQDSIRAFFGVELDGEINRPKGDYPWAGGSRP